MKSYQMDQRTCSLEMEWLDMSNSSTAVCWQTQLAVYSLLRITKTSNNHRLESAGVDDAWFC